MEPDVTSGVPEVVLDLPGLRVLAAGEYGGELEVLVETVATSVMCPRCGRRASSHGRREHLLRDIAVSGRATVLVWWKRIWRCRNTCCPTLTWSETTPGISPRAALTDRVRVWTARQVGQHGSIRVTTAGQIRAAGGTVTYAPEVGPGGVMNYNHVNVTVGETNPFGEVVGNPVPKSGRMTPGALGAPRC